MEGWSYSKAGVDLGKHKSMHYRVLDLMIELSSKLGVETGSLGGYSSWIKYGGNKIYMHVDGVGTKTLIAEKYGKYSVVGWDCIAMNVNDMVCEGVRPLAFMDYIAMPHSDERVFYDIVKGMHDAALQVRAPIIGGETAILPDLATGVDAVCFAVGVQEYSFKNSARTNDVVIGLASNGIHANGYTLVRKILENTLGGYPETYKDIRLGEELTKPTRMYHDFVFQALSENLVTGLAHITGGAYTKLKRIINQDQDIVLRMPEPPSIFTLLMELGNVPVEEMYRVFNMGIGFIATTRAENKYKVLSLAESLGHEGTILGEIVPGRGRIVLETVWGDEIVY